MCVLTTYCDSTMMEYMLEVNMMEVFMLLCFIHDGVHVGSVYDVVHDGVHGGGNIRAGNGRG